MKPRRLKEGDLVGLIAPSGYLEDAQIERGVRNLESLGLRVKLGTNLRAMHGGYAGTVAHRVDDLHAMFRDREVAGIWAARGGAGASAMLPLIDYGLVRRSPKVLVGYSDITALHIAFLRRAGLVTFHGPVSSSTFSDYSAANLRAVLMEPEATRSFSGADENFERALSQPNFEMRTYREGVATGRLVGGNLSMVCAHLATPYGLQPGANLLFLEEVSEAPYRIDRMLTQLRQAEILTRATGVMLGVFSKCEANDGEPSLTLREVLEEQMSSLKVPAAYGYSFGHIAQQMTLPVGIRARFDTRAQTLTLLEAAVQ
ncbi:S66 peptidase family protein [Usitatibacter palustris]|uniref:Putative murein peptide carboxypeptidase n=1 Tax=Usitatibacter palustris TaxID=2732487 RepID=A0A6M4H4W6_9PROT|nr:LD-carboxypeptidase [Usitatibacter palustris]QJR14636.1 putative murein peptide carboxypeptidase [Usitatibacter palustris]